MEYTAKITWIKASKEIFTDNKHSRSHRWQFDGGIEVVASASPHIVPLPMSEGEAVDPEEALVASASSCHMLVFLSLAAKKKYVINSYEDNPVGTMAKNDEGRMAITKIILKPKIKFGAGNSPTEEQLARLHELAHKNCFIANSLKTNIEVESH